MQTADPVSGNAISFFKYGDKFGLERCDIM
jgi:hypothetical protein